MKLLGRAGSGGLDIEMEESTAIAIAVAAGSTMVLGLTSAGIGAAVLFSAEPKKVVDTYNRDYGF